MMTKEYLGGKAILHVGDCLSVLRQMPDCSVDCVVTSPPYWGLRDYGTPPVVIGGEEGCRHKWQTQIKPAANGNVSRPVTGKTLSSSSATRKPTVSECCTKCGAWKGQLGLEPTFAEFLDHMLLIFDEVHRVLKDSGTLWLNMGDSYSPDGKHGGGSGHKNAGSLKGGYDRSADRRSGIRSKNLIGQPWMLAFALRDAGWWLRSDIVWSKPNPMPESAQDRPTRSHEYIFMLAKDCSKYRLWRNALTREWSDKPQSGYAFAPVGAASSPAGTGLFSVDDSEESKLLLEEARPDALDDGREWQRIKLWTGYNYYFDADAIRTVPSPETKLLSYESMDFRRRIVYKKPDGWDTGKGAHGSYHRSGREKGQKAVRQRGRARPHAGFNDRWDAMPVSQQQAAGANARTVWSIATRPFQGAHFATFPLRLPWICILAGCPPDGIVLDPFAGSGTVLEAAVLLGRSSIGIELNPTYVPLVEQRLMSIDGVLPFEAA